MNSQNNRKFHNSVILFLAIALAFAIIGIYENQVQYKKLFNEFNTVMEQYAELKDEQFLDSVVPDVSEVITEYDLDEANEEGYEAGFKTGWIEAMNEKLSTFHNITLEPDGKTISFIDELGERYTWEIDNDLS